MPDASAVEFVIQGTALDGKLFWPGDWAERLCGVMVDVRLEQIEPMAYRFLLSFARGNESRSTLEAVSLLPAATAFFTFLMAVRTEVRSLMLWMRRCTAWWARLRADLMFAMKGWVRKRGRILA